MSRTFIAILGIFMALSFPAVGFANIRVDLSGCENLLVPLDRAYYLKGGTNISYKTTRGPETNYYRRDGKNASHTILNSGKLAQVVVAFPAGNSGDAFWLKASDEQKSVGLKMLEPSPRTYALGSEHGVRFTVQTDSNDLILKQAVLGSVRDIRDYEHDQIKYEDADVKIFNQTVLITRKRLDGKGRYTLQLSMPKGTLVQRNPQDGSLRFSSNKNVQIVVDALTSDEPLNPLAATDIFEPEALKRLSVEDIQGMLFLVSQEKVLAGSWRYNTYFGRDSMLTMRMMAKYLRPQVLESIIASVLNRMSKEGVVAHEEDIGDKATRANIQAGRGAVNTPVYDYKMVDDDFLLSILFETYWKKASARQVAAFLDRHTDPNMTVSRTFREALDTNLKLCIEKSQAFAEHPIYSNLISLKPGNPTGTWQDSRSGLGEKSKEELKAEGITDLHKAKLIGGRFPFDVNVALVPAALRVAATVYSDLELGLLHPSLAERASSNLSVWSKQARPLFQIEIPASEAVAATTSYLKSLGLPTLRPSSAPVTFSAIALDAEGAPVKIMHSGGNAEMLFGNPSEHVLNEIADTLLRPFPYGLLTPIGLLIANPAFADLTTQARFAPDKYHGALVWAWQMAMMEQGLATQLERTDLSPATHNRIERAHRALWAVIETARPHLKEELWTWKSKDGHMRYEPFAEGNDLQLWSQIFLVLRNPYCATCI